MAIDDGPIHVMAQDVGDRSVTARVGPGRKRTNVRLRAKADNSLWRRREKA